MNENRELNRTEEDIKEEKKEELHSAEVVFILDRSGSMSGMEDDTIGGFNANIEKQKKDGGKCVVSTVLFDNRTEVIHDRIGIEDIDPMTREEYYVGGSTALLDAVGGAIKHISDVHRYIRKEDVPEKTIFVIITDGMENASHIYTYDKVKSMIEEYQNERGWEFMFIGANIDAVAEGGRLGIRRERSVRYERDSEGTRKVFDGACARICECKRNIDSGDRWAREIRRDYERKNRKAEPQE